MDNTLRELTEKLLQKDQELREKAHFSIAVFDFNPVPMIVTTVPSGVIIKINKAFSCSSKYDPNDLIGKTTECLYANKEDREKIIAKIKSCGSVADEEMMFRTASGKTFVGAMYVNMAKINEVDHFISAIIDKTEIRKLAVEASIYQEELLSQGEELRRLLNQQEKDAMQFKRLLGTFMEETIPRKILIIDDEQDNLIVIKVLLSSYLPQPCMIYTADNGPIGIDLAVTYDPDVILLDIVMPEMNGLEVCRQLKKFVPLVPIIFITAYGDEPDLKAKAREAGGDGFLTKPFDTNELITQIQAMVKVKALEKIKLSGILDN